MPEQLLDLNISLQDEETDREELDRLTQQLRDEIIGEGSRSVFTRCLVRGLETGEANLGGADLPALYRNAALFAFPSLYEGFGLPVLEATAWPRRCPHVGGYRPAPGDDRPRARSSSPIHLGASRPPTHGCVRCGTYSYPRACPP